jgi:hypothetical protein
MCHEDFTGVRELIRHVNKLMIQKTAEGASAGKDIFL